LTQASPTESRPKAVKNWTGCCCNRAICTATTAPPPAGSCRVRKAWPMAPGRGNRSTARNSTHSTWPTTAKRRGGRAEPEDKGRWSCWAPSSLQERLNNRMGADGERGTQIRYLSFAWVFLLLYLMSWTPVFTASCALLGFTSSGRFII